MMLKSQFLEIGWACLLKFKINVYISFFKCMHMLKTSFSVFTKVYDMLIGDYI